MLGISRTTLYRRVATGEIMIHKLGSIPLVNRETMERLLREKAEAAAAESAATVAADVLNGRVYFIDDGFFIKIGFSKKPQDRIIKLQTASPFKLTLIRTVLGNKKLEAELHTRFRHLKSHGEWFRGERELRQHIREMPRPKVSK